MFISHRILYLVVIVMYLIRIRWFIQQQNRKNHGMQGLSLRIILLQKWWNENLIDNNNNNNKFHIFLP